MPCALAHSVKFTRPSYYQNARTLSIGSLTDSSWEPPGPTTCPLQNFLHRGHGRLFDQSLAQVLLDRLSETAP